MPQNFLGIAGGMTLVGGLRSASSYHERGGHGEHPAYTHRANCEGVPLAHGNVEWMQITVVFWVFKNQYPDAMRVNDLEEGWRTFYTLARVHKLLSVEMFPKYRSNRGSYLMLAHLTAD